MKTALLLFFSLTFSFSAGATENLPTVTYLEGMLEKEVSWPVMVQPLLKVTSKEGPGLKVWIGVPNLIQLGSSGGSYKIHSTKKRPLPFKSFNSVNNYIYFETHQKVSLFKFTKENSGNTAQEIALKVSFPADTHFVQFSLRCKRKWILKKFLASSTIQPFLTYVDCPNSHEIAVKTSPEVEFPEGKKQLDYALQTLPLVQPRKDSSLHLTLEIAQGDLKDRMQMTLSSIGDVVERFNYEHTTAAQETDGEFKGLSLLGFSLSEEDPEIFGEVDLKREGWLRSLEFGGYWSLPALLKGSSVKNRIDGRLYLLLNNPLNDPQSTPKYSFSLGPALRKTSQFQLGPQIRLGAQKLIHFSKDSSLGAKISAAGYGRERFYELDTAVSFARKDGRLLEPHLIFQNLEFGNGLKRDFTVKIGFGARW